MPQQTVSHNDPSFAIVGTWNCRFLPLVAMGMNRKSARRHLQAMRSETVRSEPQITRNCVGRVTHGVIRYCSG